MNTLIKIKNKCKFLWCVLASGSIADRTESGTAVKYLSTILGLSGNKQNNEDLNKKLKESLKETIEVISFSHVMRNSQSIVNVASPEFYNSYIKNRFHDINMAIKPGNSGTVIGSKPTAIIWKQNIQERFRNIFGYRYNFDYNFFANRIFDYVNENIKTMEEERKSKYISVAVLTEGNISAAELYNAMTKKFQTKIFGYGYGVTPSESSDIENWLKDGGILVTDCES